MSRILELPRLIVPMTVRTNEDWRDSWAYLDGNGGRISLAGIRLVLMLRSTPEDRTAHLVASNMGAPAGTGLNGRLVTGGEGGEVLGIAIPASSMSRLASGEYVHEVMAEAETIKRVIATGPVTIIKGVVR